MEAPKQTFALSEFSTKVSDYLRNVPKDLPTQLAKVSEIAREALMGLDNSTTQEKPRSVQALVEILETLDSKLQSVEATISTGKTFFSSFSRSAQEKELYDAMSKVRAKLAEQKAIETKLWNGDGLFFGAISLFSDRFMLGRREAFNQKGFNEDVVQLRLAAFRLMGQERFKSKDLDGLPVIFAYMGILEDIETFVLCYQHKMSEHTQKLFVDLSAGLKASLEIAKKMEFIKFLANPAPIAFDKAGLEKTNDDQRMEDIVHEIRKQVKALAPGQEMLIPGGVSATEGAHAVQFAIGLDSNQTYHFRIIDTGGAFLEMKSFFSQIGVVLNKKSSDHAFKNALFSDVTDSEMLKGLIQLYTGKKKLENLKDMYVQIFEFFKSKGYQLSEMSKHQIQSNNTCSETSIMAWLETVADPKVYGLIVLHRIKRGLEILSGLEQKEWTHLSAIVKEIEFYGRSVLYELRKSGVEEFYQKDFHMKRALEGQMDKSAISKKFEQLMEEQKQLTKELAKWTACKDPEQITALKKAVEKLKTDYCGLTKQNVNSPTLREPGFFELNAKAKFEEYNQMVSKLAQLQSPNGTKLIDEKIIFIEKQIERNAEAQKELSLTNTYESDFKSLLDALSINKKIEEVEVEGFKFEKM